MSLGWCVKVIKFIVMSSLTILSYIIEPYRFTIKNITREIGDVEDWKSLGMNLKLDPTKLSEIEHDCHGVDAECRQAMVEFWVNSDTSASWKRLAAALEGISHHVKAQEVRELARKESE